MTDQSTNKSTDKTADKTAQKTDPQHGRLEGLDNTIDQDTQDFIALSGSFYQDTRADFSIHDQRQQYAALCQHFNAGRPQGVTAEDQMIEGVPVRFYAQNPKPLGQVIYIHGGGFVVGGLDSHDDVCAEICAHSQCDVYAIDYRLAPEHKHPAALEDCQRVIAHLVEEEFPTVVAGDSAGGWLAAMVGHGMGDMLMGQVLIYPMLGGALNQGSFVDWAEAPMLTTTQVKFYWEEYFDCPLQVDQLTPPMAYPDVGQAPPTVVLGAGCDPLFSDTLDYAEKLKQHHVWHKVIVAEGLPHGFLRARHSVPKAQRATGHVMDAITALVHGGIQEEPRLDDTSD